MNFAGKKILVLGAGTSGQSAAEFLRARCAAVEIFDDKNGKNPDTNGFDFCVISPGVSINHPVARKFNGRIISELALGFTATHKKIVAVTGTNGKTTVTNMIGAALGVRGVVCGNVGVPVTSVSGETAKKIAVAEVSSFMLEAEIGFRPDIAVILNIAQDHLERHGTMREYIRCKSKILCAKRAILNYDCPNCRALGDKKTLYFSAKTAVRGVFLVGGKIYYRPHKRAKKLFDLKDFREDRPHQIANILAVILVCKLLGVPRKRILAACMGGTARAHRIEHVGTVGNVSFVNDSKATNIAASLAACACFQGPIHLLLGGITKGQNFDEMFVKLPGNVDRIFAFGAGADEIFAAAQRGGFVKSIETHKTMRMAAIAAAKYGFGPRVVLLSPACSSFDEFNNYEERGKAFAELVKELAHD